MRRITAAMLLVASFVCAVSADRGHLVAYGNKYMWSGTQQAVVPNYIMLETLMDRRLNTVTEQAINTALDLVFDQQGFNGLHVTVYGQWVKIGSDVVDGSITQPDPQTFDKLEMIIRTVSARGGMTHLWMWGDRERSQSSANLNGGIMGATEKRIIDMIYSRLNDLPGLSIGYGFDLWEWVSGAKLKEWHDYCHAKPNWRPLLGARSHKYRLDQMYNGLDYSSYEMHKPWYDVGQDYGCIQMMDHESGKPSFSEDRYRVRIPPRYPLKDYTEAEIQRGLWHHTIAGGVAAIWGQVAGNGVFSNKDLLKTFGRFWNDNKRFRKDMVRDNSVTDGWCLRDGRTQYVMYKENTSSVRIDLSNFTGTLSAVAVDAKRAYQEVAVSVTKSNQTWTAPRSSDWAIAVGDFGGAVSVSDRSSSAAGTTVPQSTHGTRRIVAVSGGAGAVGNKTAFTISGQRIRGNVSRQHISGVMLLQP